MDSWRRFGTDVRPCWLPGRPPSMSRIGPCSPASSRGGLLEQIRSVWPRLDTGSARARERQLLPAAGLPESLG